MIRSIGHTRGGFGIRALWQPSVFDPQMQRPGFHREPLSLLTVIFMISSESSGLAKRISIWSQETRSLDSATARAPIPATTTDSGNCAAAHISRGPTQDHSMELKEENTESWAKLRVLVPQWEVIVPLTKPDVKRWFDSVAPGVGVTVLSIKAGFSRMRIFQQLAGDRVQEETIIKVSRVMGLDPLEQLRTFSGYETLLPSRPDPREVGAFIQWQHLMRACSAIELDEPVTEESLGPKIFGETSRQWIDGIDPDGGLRKHLQERGPISNQGLSKMLNGPLRLDLAVLATQYAQIPEVSALVAARLLSPAEAGWVDNERVQWLQALEKTERLQLVETRIHSAIVREQRSQDFINHLG